MMQAVKDVPYGAIYFSMDCPSDFTNLQDTLLVGP